MDVPAWLPADLSHPKYDEPRDRLRLRGSAHEPRRALTDLIDVLDCEPRQGYQLSKCEAAVEHTRGPRLTWSVTWIKTSVAERARKRKSAERLSRFEVT